MLVHRVNRVFQVGLRTFSTSTTSADFLQWEEMTTADLPEPLASDEEEPEPTRKARFYVPPPFSDEQLLALKKGDIQDWPKSRVVWALGRLGYSKSLKSATDLSKYLFSRADALQATLNTRDMVRMIQAAAYGPPLTDTSTVLAVRRKLCSEIDKVSEAYLASLIYGHLKLVSKLWWKATPACGKATQFLLSELIHRKAKIDASRFVEIATVLVSNPRIVKEHSDSVQTILRMAIQDSLKHVKTPHVLAEFGKALAGIPSQQFFAQINEAMKKKFEPKKFTWRNGNDALHAGFYYLFADLVSVPTIVAWLQCVKSATVPLTAPALGETSQNERRKTAESVQMIQFVKLVLQQRNTDTIVPADLMEWLNTFPVLPEEIEPAILFGSSSVKGMQEPLLGVESMHVSAVLRRIVSATIDDGFLSTKIVGPFLLPLCNADLKIYIQWTNQHELEVPHRRGVAKAVELLRREYLKTNDWKILEIDRTQLRVSETVSQQDVNVLFRSILSDGMGDVSVPWKEAGEPNAERSIAIPLIEPIEEAIRKHRREARSRQYRFKSQMQSIRKQFRRKHSRKLKQ